MLTAILLIGLFIVAIALGFLLRIWAGTFTDPDNDDDDYDDFPDDDDDDQWWTETIAADAPWEVINKTELITPSEWLSQLRDPVTYEPFLFRLYAPVELEGEWLANQLSDWWEWKTELHDDILNWHEELTGVAI